MTPGDEKVPRVASVSECLKHRVSGALQSQGPGSARLNTWFVQGGQSLVRVLPKLLTGQGRQCQGLSELREWPGAGGWP